MDALFALASTVGLPGLALILRPGQSATWRTSVSTPRTAPRCLPC